MNPSLALFGLLVYIAIHWNTVPQTSSKSNAANRVNTTQETKNSKDANGKFKTVFVKKVEPSRTYTSQGNERITAVNPNPQLYNSINNSQMQSARNDHYQTKYQNGIQNMMNNPPLHHPDSHHYFHNDHRGQIPVNHQLSSGVYASQQTSYQSPNYQQAAGNYNLTATVGQAHSGSQSQSALSNSFGLNNKIPSTTTSYTGQMYSPMNNSYPSPLSKQYSQQMYGHLNNHHAPQYDNSPTGLGPTKSWVNIPEPVYNLSNSSMASLEKEPEPYFVSDVAHFASPLTYSPY